MLKKSDQKGFTLIEIIAVLVILGILAAVAIPKYFNMQAQARQKAVDAALAALQSTTSMNYSRALLSNPPTANATACTTCANASVNVGDYYGSITLTGDVFTVVVSGPGDLINGVGVADRTKAFQLW